MEDPVPAVLIPEQIVALAAGGGYALCEDPKTHVIYHMVQHQESPALDDDYVRKKLAEAYADIEQNGLKPWDLNELKREYRFARFRDSIATVIDSPRFRKFSLVFASYLEIEPADLLC